MLDFRGFYDEALYKSTFYITLHYMTAEENCYKSHSGVCDRVPVANTSWRI